MLRFHCPRQTSNIPTFAFSRKKSIRRKFGTVGHLKSKKRPFRNIPCDIDLDTPRLNWHWQLKKVQRVLTIKSSFSCIRLSYFHWIECFWWVLFEIMQNLHLLRLPKSAYFYLVSKSDIDRPSKRTHQNSSILWKLLSPMHEKELWVVKTLWTFFRCQCQFGHGVWYIPYSRK